MGGAPAGTHAGAGAMCQGSVHGGPPNRGVGGTVCVCERGGGLLMLAKGPEPGPAPGPAPGGGIGTTDAVTDSCNMLPQHGHGNAEEEDIVPRLLRIGELTKWKKNSTQNKESR